MESPYPQIQFIFKSKIGDLRKSHGSFEWNGWQTGLLLLPTEKKKKLNFGVEKFYFRAPVRFIFIWDLQNP